MLHHQRGAHKKSELYVLSRYHQSINGWCTSWIKFTYIIAVLHLCLWPKKKKKMMPKETTRSWSHFYDIYIAKYNYYHQWYHFLYRSDTRLSMNVLTIETIAVSFERLVAIIYFYFYFYFTIVGFFLDFLAK